MPCCFFFFFFFSFFFLRIVSFFNSNGIQTYIILNWESLLVTYFGGICNKQLVSNFGTMFKSLPFFLILCSNHSLGHFRNSRAKKKNEEGQPVKRRLKLSVQIKLIYSLRSSSSSSSNYSRSSKLEVYFDFLDTSNLLDLDICYIYWIHSKFDVRQNNL